MSCGWLCSDPVSQCPGGGGDAIRSLIANAVLACRGRFTSLRSLPPYLWRTRRGRLSSAPPKEPAIRAVAVPLAPMGYMARLTPMWKHWPPRASRAPCHSHSPLFATLAACPNTPSDWSHWRRAPSPVPSAVLHLPHPQPAAASQLWTAPPQHPWSPALPQVAALPLHPASHPATSGVPPTQRSSPRLHLPF